MLDFTDWSESKYTLDITEAVKALNEGKCDEIESEFGGKWKCPPIDSVNSVLFPIDWHVVTIKKILGKWRLIGVKKRTEERTIKYWLVIYNEGRTSLWDTEPSQNVCSNYIQQIIPLSHTYTYTLPEETLHPVMGKILNKFEKGDDG